MTNPRSQNSRALLAFSDHGSGVSYGARFKEVATSESDLLEPRSPCTSTHIPIALLRCAIVCLSLTLLCALALKFVYALHVQRNMQGSWAPIARNENGFEAFVGKRTRKGGIISARPQCTTLSVCVAAAITITSLVSAKVGRKIGPIVFICHMQQTQPSSVLTAE